MILDNPLLDQYRKLMEARNRFQNHQGASELIRTSSYFANELKSRFTLQHTFAYAVPTEEALAAVVRHAPKIVELGAGRGYWAGLLNQMGADVICYDIRPPIRRDTNNHYFRVGEYEDKNLEVKMWHPVEKGEVESLDNHHDRALMLCWPPYNTSMAADAVKLWRGDVLVYIGEGPTGCTGDDVFHAHLREKFTCIETVKTPTFPGLYDQLEIYKRI